MIDTKNLLVLNKKTNEMKPFIPKLSKKSSKALLILFLTLGAFLLTISIMSWTAVEIERTELPVTPSIKLESIVIIFIGIGLVVSYLRNPYQYKDCPYQGSMFILYFPIIIGVVFFVRYAVMIGILFINIPELEFGIDTPLTIYYGSEDQIVFSVLAWHEIFFLFLGEAGLGITIFIFIDLYKASDSVCKSWENGEKTKRKMWESGQYKIPISCREYKKGYEICKHRVKKKK